MCLVNDTRPVVLDLCSGSGGAAAGYARAGYRVICIDNDPRHARALDKLGIEFHCLDWAKGFRRFGHLADLIHVSPPCQRYSKASVCRPGLAAESARRLRRSGRTGRVVTRHRHGTW
jgi:DNA (cytosine-5)-methyltransferase 1